MDTSRQNTLRALATPRIILVAVSFGAAALFTMLAGLHIRFPGTGIIADPMEVFVAIGAAFTGPVGGVIIGILSGLGDPDPSVRLYSIAMHVVGCVWIGWAYKRLVHDRLRMPAFLLGWNAVLLVYFFVCTLPVLLLVRMLFPEFSATILDQNLPLSEAIVILMRGWVFGYILTACTTSLVFLVLPRHFRAPLWSYGWRDAVRQARAPGGYRRILGLRLTFWFLLLSLLPLAIVAVFIRNNLKTVVFEQRAEGELELVRVLTHELVLTGGTPGTSGNRDSPLYGLDDWFVLDTLQQYITHTDTARIGRSARQDFSSLTLARLAEDVDGFVEDDDSGMLLIFAQVPGKPWKAVITRPSDEILATLRLFEQTSFFRLAMALLILSATAGLIIWLIVGSPMRRLTDAVQRFGKGEREVRVDTQTMADEIEILGGAFNEMAENIGILHSGLEQEIRDRRQAEKALRESEHKFQQMAELLPQPVFETDADGRITFANRAAFSAFGYGAEDLARGFSILDMVSSGDRVRATQDTRRVLEGNESGGNEYQMQRRDGTEFPALVYTAAILSENRPAGIRGIVVDITEQKHAAGVLQQAVHEKEILLKEVHHRVKNNLQIISSLLNLQAEALNDPRDRALFMESETRVRSMALIHERLYKSEDFARVEFKEYIESLVVSLFHSFGHGGVTYHVDVEEVRLPIDVAIPCGLIVNELITNALKHAFPGGRLGHITVSLHQESDGTFILEVQDNGIGLPEDLRPSEAKSLGLHLVSILTRQLQGELEIQRGDGTLFRVHFGISVPQLADAKAE